MPHERWLLLVVILMIDSGSALAQRHAKSRAAPPAVRAAGAPTTDQYWAAQRSIEAAIQQLDAYLKAHPDGEHASTARQQLEALRALSTAASLPEWASMEPRAYDRASQWRITSVERRTDKTSVTVEIRCPRADGGECYFDPFDRAPLVLVDNAGRFYPMLGAGSLPRDVSITGRERAEVLPGQAALSGGRAIAVTLEFAPFANGVVSVQAYYRDENRAAPAKFNLLGRR